jgi:hypothetical protein
MQVDLEELISAHSDSHVSQSAKQESKKETQMTGGSGMKLLEYYKLANRNGSLLKMLKVLLPSKTAFCSNIVSLVWKMKVTKYNRLLFQLVPKTHHTDEIEFGSSDSSLPTPTTQETEHPNVVLTKNNRRLSKNGKSSHSLNLADTMKLWPTPRTTGGSRPNGKGGKVLEEEVKISVGLRQRGKKLKEQMWPTPRASSRMAYAEKPTKSQIEGTHGWNLNAAVTDSLSEKPNRMWPTPNSSPVTVSQTVEATLKLRKRNRKQGQLMEAVVDKMFPTPTATEARQGYQDRTKGKLGTQKSLSTEIIDSEGGRKATVGQLNSEWVTWIMGYPQGYLDISTENHTISQELQQEKKTEPKS